MPHTKELIEVMDKLPELTAFGIGIFESHYKQSLDEQRQNFAQEREELIQEASRVSDTVEWIRDNLTPQRGINRCRTSYGLKHVAEHDVGYITNGVFIAAAIIAGYKYELISSAPPGYSCDLNPERHISAAAWSPNPCFNISEKSISEISKQRSDPERYLQKSIRTAFNLLKDRGLKPKHASGKNTIYWKENDDVRTLIIAPYQKQPPFIVRLFIDNYTVHPKGHLSMIQPTRSKGEISLLAHEVENCLEWALTYDSRHHEQQQPPPFEPANKSSNPFYYVWSERADAAMNRLSRWKESKHK